MSGRADARAARELAQWRRQSERPALPVITPEG